MKKNLFGFNKLTVNIFSVFILLFLACSDDDNGSTMPEENNDAVYLLTLRPPGVTGEFKATHLTSNLADGELSIQDAQESGISRSDAAVMIDGKLFSFNPDQSSVIEYELVDGALTVKQEKPFTVSSDRARTFESMGDNKMIVLLNGYYPTGDGIPFEVFSTQTLESLQNGVLEVPINPNSLAWPNGAIAKEGKLYLNYIHCDDVNYANYDAAYTAVYDLSTLAYEKTIEDPRTASPGFNISPDAMFDSSDNLYISPSNSNYWGVNENLPSGILRINQGETDFDASYFFNVTEKVNGNHFVNLIKVAENKAVIKVMRSDLITGYADYSDAFITEHYVVDVSNQTVDKLDIPLSKIVYMNIVETEDGSFAIPVNTEEGSFIYLLNPQDNSVSKGLKYTGADAIDNLFRLK